MRTFNVIESSLSDHFFVLSLRLILFYFCRHESYQLERFKLRKLCLIWVVKTLESMEFFADFLSRIDHQVKNLLMIWSEKSVEARSNCNPIGESRVHSEYRDEES